jgi:hypothetical protein
MRSAAAMHIVEILLPLYGNDGRRFGAAMFLEVRKELVERFGGLTAFTQSPAEGLWEEEEGEVTRDEIVIFEVMAEALDRGWWGDYRRRLERCFEQEAIVIRAREVTLL